jgi:hypothetical protein
MVIYFFTFWFPEWVHEVWARPCVGPAVWEGDGRSFASPYARGGAGENLDLDRWNIWDHSPNPMPPLLPNQRLLSRSPINASFLFPNPPRAVASASPRFSSRAWAVAVALVAASLGGPHDIGLPGSGGRRPGRRSRWVAASRQGDQPQVFGEAGSKLSASYGERSFGPRVAS